MFDRNRAISRELLAIIKPHSPWKPAPTEQEEQAAKHALCLFYHRLSQCKPAHSRGAPYVLLHYLHELMLVYLTLHQKRYRDTCNELEKLLHFNQITSPPIRANVLALLKEHLEVDHEGTMEQKAEADPEQPGL